jgi:hypothetical protein
MTLARAFAAELASGATEFHALFANFILCAILGKKPALGDARQRRAPRRFAFASLGFELFLQQPHRAQFGIAAKDRAHEFGLSVDDDQLAVPPAIPERRHPAHPHPFFFEAAILSRMRSPMTSRSNCAKDNRTLRVRR